MIGSGGADGYVTKGIPHAWLVSPQGQVVWTAIRPTSRPNKSRSI